MPRVPDLIGRLRLDTRDLDRAKGEVNKFARNTQSTGGKIGSALTGGLDEATTALTGGLGAAGVQAKATLDRIGTSALASGSALQFGLAGGAIAGGLVLTKFATDGVEAFASLAEEVRDFRRASGSTAEDASRFVAVFDDLQISSQAGATAIQRLAREVAAGAPKLKQYGIEVARNADGTTNLTETLLNVADAYSRSPDTSTRAAIAFAAFGKQAQTLIPLLDKGRDGLEEFFESAEGHGQILNDEDLARAEELRLAIDEMHDAMRGVQLIGAKALVPFITSVAEATARVAGFFEEVERRSGGLLSKIGGFVGKSFARQVGGPIGQALVDFADGAKGAESASSDAAGPVADLGSVLDDAGSSAFGSAGALAGWGDAASRVADQIKAITESQERRRSAALSVLDAEQANRRASDSFGSALDRVAEVERDLTRARSDRTDAARRALSAERALQSVESARSGVVDAERDLDRARAGRGQRARQLADAEKALRGAQDAVASAKGMRALRDAQEGLAEAEQRVSDARAEGGRDEDVRSATEALTRAQLDAKSAALELAEAREQSSKRQVTAEDAVAAAHQGAVDSALSAARAAQELAEQRAKAEGIPFTVDDEYRVFRDTLIDLKDRTPLGPIRSEIEGMINQLRELPPTKTVTVIADTSGAQNALGAVRATVQALQGDIANALVGVQLPTPEPVVLPITADATPVRLALEGIRSDTARTSGEVRLMGTSVFVPFTSSADEASRKVTTITSAVVDVRSAVRDPLRLTADVTQPIAEVTRLRDLVGELRIDTGNVLASLSTLTPGLGAPGAATTRTPAVAPGSTTTTVVNNNTTVNALGANADVARDIDYRQAREVARAR